MQLSVIFVVILALGVVLIYSPYSSNIFVQGKPVAGGHIECDLGEIYGTLTCCWWEDKGAYSAYVCQTCHEDGTNCGPIVDCPFPCDKSSTSQPSGPFAPLQDGVLEQPPTPPPSDPAAPLKGGVLEQLEQGGGGAPGFEPGFLERQQLQPPAEQGAAELAPPTSEGTQPATVEEEPPVPVCQEGLEFNEDLGFCVPENCPEGQVLDEEAGICVLEEQPVEQQEQTSEEPQDEQQPTEEEQPSEESGSEEENGNN